MVVEGDMDKFPTGAGRGLRAICGDPMSWAAEAPELLMSRWSMSPGSGCS